jgi:hypothetical protein
LLEKAQDDYEIALANYEPPSLNGSMKASVIKIVESAKKNLLKAR